MYNAEHRFTNLLMTDCLFHLQFAKWRCSTLIARGRSPHRVPVLELRACHAGKGRTVSSRELNYPPGTNALSAGLTATTEIKYTKKE